MALGERSLKRLQLQLQDSDTSKHIVDEDSVRFPGLESAWLSTCEDDFKSIGPKIPNVHELALSLDSPASCTLRQCSSLINLTDVEISLSHGQQSSIAASDLLKFAKRCTKLRHLRIATIGGAPIAMGVTDEVMDRVTKRLPHLQSLCLEFEEWPVTEHCLFSLAKHCPKLEYCILPAKISVLSFINGISRSLFPSLKTLVTMMADGHIEGGESSSYYEAVAKSILVAAPMLQSCIFEGDDAGYLNLAIEMAIAEKPSSISY